MSENTVTIIVAIVTALGSVITALVGWLAKRGVLATGGEIEPSVAWELVASKGKSWLTSGWSLDAILQRFPAFLALAYPLPFSQGLVVQKRKTK